MALEDIDCDDDDDSIRHELSMEADRGAGRADGPAPGVWMGPITDMPDETLVEYLPSADDKAAIESHWQQSEVGYTILESPTTPHQG